MTNRPRAKGTRRVKHHYVCWDDGLLRFDGETYAEAKAKAYAWLRARGYGLSLDAFKTIWRSRA